MDHVSRYCTEPNCERCRRQRSLDAQFAHTVAEPEQYTDPGLYQEELMEEAIRNGD